MNIKLTLPEHAADYIRHARLETLKAIGEVIRPELLEPSPFGSYLLAYGEDGDRPVGMAEFAFYGQVYESFENCAYPTSLGLADFGPFESFVGTRTIYVEPEARGQVPPYYLMMSMAGCRYAYECGAQFTTASTNAANGDLMRLYSKTGGTLVGTFRDEKLAKSEIAVFVFELATIMNHRAMGRLEGKIEIDPEVASILRSRGTTTGARKVA